MTLRYDRIDNFWFTLLHELAHVRLHLDGSGDDNGFVDDHNLRGVESGGDTKEQEADLIAQDALIPRDVWDDGAILEHPTPMAVLDLGGKRESTRPSWLAASAGNWATTVCSPSSSARERGGGFLPTTTHKLNS